MLAVSACLGCGGVLPTGQPPTCWSFIILIQQRRHNALRGFNLCRCIVQSSAAHVQPLWCGFEAVGPPHSRDKCQLQGHTNITVTAPTSQTSYIDLQKDPSSACVNAILRTLPVACTACIVSNVPVAESGQLQQNGIAAPSSHSADISLPLSPAALEHAMDRMVGGTALGGQCRLASMQPSMHNGAMNPAPLDCEQRFDPHKE